MRAPYTLPVVGGLTPLASEGAEVAVAGAVAAAFLSAVVLVVRRVRGFLRALRSDARLRRAVALIGTVRAGLRGGSLRGPAYWRLELWQAVGAATRAVRVAAESGGALADLPGLVRRLRESAAHLDAVLGSAADLHPSSPEAGAIHQQVGAVIDAASAIRRGALASASLAAASGIGLLVADAGQELESITAGAARSSATLGSDRREATLGGD